jgi:uncharacterized protein YcnI
MPRAAATLRATRSRRLVRVAVVLVAALLATGLSGTAASAHVTVNPTRATQGADTELTFSVPTEKDSASTVKIEIDLPVQAPIATVAVRPVPGWTSQVTRTKLATPIDSGEGKVTEVVTRVVWTASPSAAIKPGEYQDFTLSVGPLPAVDRLVVKAVQTYSDGEVVRWIEEPSPGVEEPEHPAMVITLARSGSTGGVVTVPTPAGSSSGGSAGTLAVLLSVLALLVSLGLAGFILVGRLAGRRP